MPLPAPDRPLSVDNYLELKRRLAEAGYGAEVDWSEGLRPVDDPDVFWTEYAWVVLNSGMKNTVARKIWDKVQPVVRAGGRAESVFGHKGKANAINLGWQMKETWLHHFRLLQDDESRLHYLRSLPWIGEITCWHLAKNFGMDVAKPDRHLVRIAGAEGTHALCARLAKATGHRIATVDLVIWRAASLGWL